MSMRNCGEESAHTSITSVPVEDSVQQILVIKPRSPRGESLSLRAVQRINRIYNPNAVYWNYVQGKMGTGGMVMAGYHHLFRVEAGLPLGSASVVRF